MPDEAAAQPASQALPALGPDALYADLNTAGPEAKRRQALSARDGGAAFVDVAVLAPVARARLADRAARPTTGGAA